MKRTISFILVFAMLISIVPNTFFANEEAYAQEEDKEYEIYPIPQSIEYAGGTFDVSDEVNLVLESTLDTFTVKKAKDILDGKGISYTEGEEKVEGKTNILVGTNGSGEYVDKYFENVTIEKEDIFDEIDAYVLHISDGDIAILGKNTDGSFYGLVSLYHIFNQLDGSTIMNLHMEDYASTKIRGFIEGYYGIPWSDENRASLMEFGGDFKMTTYVFAPKDDPYHRDKWFEPYPEEELKNIEALAKVGNENKTRYAWTISPFVSYKGTQKEQDQVIAKFEQLYDVGVRQFGVLGDDVGRLDLSAVTELMDRVSEWVKDKGDVYDILFCPASYNAGWAWNPYELDRYERDFPDNIQIFWTGQTTCYPIDQWTVDQFKTKGNPSKTRRDPLFWLNWPVNDIDKVQMPLYMGKGEMLNPGVKNLAGAVTNPMQEAQASKNALFAVADYTWNINDFNADQSWIDGFKYIDKDAPEELHEISKHMSNTYGKGIGNLEESEELKPFLNAYNAAYTTGKGLKEAKEALIPELDKIIDACNDFHLKSKNEELKKELLPFTNALRDMALSIKATIEGIEAIREDDIEGVWTNYNLANTLYNRSQNYDRPELNGPTKAIPSRLRVLPFLQDNLAKFNNEARKVLDLGTIEGELDITTDNIIMSPSYSIYSNINALIDGDFNSFTWFNTGAGNNSKVGDYVGLDLKSPRRINKVTLKMGGNSTSDYWDEYTIVGSNDLTNWDELSEKTVQDNFNMTTTYDFGDKNYEYRYVAVRNDKFKANWVQMSEFNVEIVTKQAEAYTNVDSLKESPSEDLGTSAKLLPIDNVTLKPGEYIGLKLTKDRKLSSIDVDDVKGLTLETSETGFLFEEVTNMDDLGNARYIRLKNNSEEDVTFDLTKFNIEIDLDLVEEDGEEIPKSNDYSIVTDSKQSSKNYVASISDLDLETAYYPNDGEAGEIIYKITEGNNRVERIRIFGNIDVETDAKVSVLTDIDTWKELGMIDKSYKVFDTSDIDRVVEIKIEWSANMAPYINEVLIDFSEESDIPEERPDMPLTNKSELKALVKEAEDLNKDLYTEETFEALKKALDEAKVVLNNNKANQDEINMAVKNLKEAMDSLVEKPKKTGWAQEGEFWYYYKDGEKIVNKWIWAELDLDGDGKYEGHNWKYFNKEGKSQDTFYIDGDNIWLSQKGPDKEYLKGWWTNEEGMTYYFRETSGSRVSGKQYIDGAWRYFRESGTLLRGWQYVESAWRYFRDDGTMVIDKWVWLPIDTDMDGEYEGHNWKYFNKDGKSQLTFYFDNGNVWLSQVGPNRGYYRGWWTNEVGMKYYFRESSGSRVNGWQYIEGSWRYFRQSGSMVTGKQFIDNKWYNFKEDGTLIGSR